MFLRSPSVSPSSPSTSVSPPTRVLSVCLLPSLPFYLSVLSFLSICLSICLPLSIIPSLFLYLSSSLSLFRPFSLSFSPRIRTPLRTHATGAQPVNYNKKASSFRRFAHDWPGCLIKEFIRGIRTHGDLSSATSMFIFVQTTRA